MSNSFFKFKQFVIYQNNCAMKICTDACLFGAYISEFIKENIIQDNSINILDIGTGTGLLSLMVAQKNKVNIHAVEIDNSASKQAEENFNKSIFKNKISIYNEDILSFKSNLKYDFILSNPPFFTNDLKSYNHQNNLAKHDTSLTLIQLLNIIIKNLNEEGLFAVLLPYHRVTEFINLCNNADYYLVNKILIKQTINHNYFRGILIFGKQKNNDFNTEIIIKNKDDIYSNSFIYLLKDYYLYL